MVITAEMSRLTVQVPERLRRRVRAIATRRGESVSHIVQTAIETYVVDELEDDEDIRTVQAIEARMKAGQERIYSHNEVWAEIEALEAQGALPD